MALVNFTNLDFDQIKSSLREYLRANSNFTDYDFEGSNLSTIIDLLAYNTYISSYNANMISNEVFIDSATLRENVVSLAGHIGYVPRSRTSAKANISFFVDTSNFTTNPKTITLQRGTVCSSANNFGPQSYTFSVLNDITVPVANNIAFFENIDVYEGTYLLERFVVNSSNKNQRFILSNANIDTSSIIVEVRNSFESTVIRTFNVCKDFCAIDAESRIFFIKEIEDQRYELVFGDGIFGKKLDNNNIVEVYHIVSNGGERANGISSFNFSGRLLDNNGRIISTGISLITANSSSQGGREIESVESIRKFAPRLYSSQKRAVTTQDYETIVASLYPEAESVSVFGGEELDPPKYGKVFIAIKPISGDFLANSIKENLKNLLRKYSVAGIVTEIIDLKYLYIEFDSSVYYNTNLSQSANRLQTRVINNIIKYSNSSELNKYGARFKYSRFLKVIDETDRSITSNITNIIIRRDLRAVLGQFSEYEICFGNRFHINDSKGYNIKSSGFRVNGYNFDLYLSDIPNTDSKTGKLIFFRVDPQTSSAVIVNPNAGRVDYVKGEIIISPVELISTSKQKLNEPIIEISATPYSNDIIGLQDLYLQLDVENSNVDMIIDTISSGTDVSGSIYKTSSSHTKREFIRK
jgi:hypothetical protein